MFTGLVEMTAKLGGAQTTAWGRRLTIDLGPLARNTRPGDSICVNGVCLTASRVKGSSAEFDIMAETLRASTLGELQTGVKVNLERAIKADGRFGGHFVQGHVDGRGRIERIENDPMGMRVRVAAGRDILKYIVEKGSVAVDGISLTVVSCDSAGFSLYLIPETVKQTIAAGWKTGDEVNIEPDILAKYVERMIGPGRTGSGAGDEGGLLRKLAEGGFV